MKINHFFILFLDFVANVFYIYVMILWQDLPGLCISVFVRANWQSGMHRITKVNRTFNIVPSNFTLLRDAWLKITMVMKMRINIR